MTEKKTDKKIFHKKAMKGGAIFGGILSALISIMMDFVAAGSLEGTWRDAIANDLHNLLSIQISPDSFIAYILFFVVMIFIAGIGALMGAIFAYIIVRFLEILTS